MGGSEVFVVLSQDHDCCIGSFDALCESATSPDERVRRLRAFFDIGLLGHHSVSGGKAGGSGDDSTLWVSLRGQLRGGTGAR